MAVPGRPDPFQRVYSPPEPPSTTRRSTLVGVIMAVVALSLAGFAVVVLGSDAEPAGPGRSPAGESPSALSTDGARPFTMLPAACGTVRRSTVRRLVPRARAESSANSTLTTCAFAAAGGGSALLRVEARIFVPVGGADPVDTATGDFAARLARARTDPVLRVVSVRRHAGLGDEAYRRFTVEKVRPEAAGEVVVRIRNAVITVSYEKNALRAGAANEREFLNAATDVAAEVIGAFK